LFELRTEEELKYGRGLVLPQSGSWEFLIGLDGRMPLLMVLKLHEEVGAYEPKPSSGEGEAQSLSASSGDGASYASSYE